MTLPHTQPWQRVIAHLDLDCFFAQAEELDDPPIRGQPVIVGPKPPAFRHDGSIDHTRSGRGIVCTANYQARAFGVRTAMPAARAHRLCPNAHYRKPRGERYRQLSKQVFLACQDFTPTVRPVGIDEAYLDLTGLDRWIASLIRRDGSPNELAALDHHTFNETWPKLLARRLQAHIQHTTGLAASIGVGPNRVTAKLASDFEKPNGCTVVTPAQTPAFTAALPLEQLRGVGPSTLERLRKRGITDAAHIVNAPREDIERLLGELGTRIWDNARAKSSDLPPPREQRKSISRDTTFEHDIAINETGLETLRATLARLLEKATFTLRKEALFARTLGVRIRDRDFNDTTHERALAKHNPHSPASDHDADLRPLAIALLRELTDAASGRTRPAAVRLIGVKLSRLTTSAQHQLAIDADPALRERRRNLDRAADTIRARLGHTAISSAAALAAQRPDPSRHDLNAQHKRGRRG